MFIEAKIIIMIFFVFQFKIITCYADAVSLIKIPVKKHKTCLNQKVNLENLLRISAIIHFAKIIEVVIAFFNNL